MNETADISASPATTKSYTNLFMVDVLWDAMSGAYGTEWTKKFGDHDTTGIWAKGLAKFRPQQIAQAIAEAIRHYQHKPPVLGQFMALCRAAGATDNRFQLKNQQEKATREECAQWLVDLKGMMAKAKSNGPMTAEQREYHEKVLGLDKDSMEKKENPCVDPASRAACVYPGCSVPGALSSTLTGSKSWYCKKHFHGIQRQ